MKNKENTILKNEESNIVKKSLINPEAIILLQEKLYSAWESNQVNKEIQDEFMKCFACLKPKLYVQTVTAEVKNLRCGTSLIQRLYANIQRRETTIKDIKELLETHQEDFTEEEINDRVLVLSNNRLKVF